MLALQERLIIEDVWFKANATGKFICTYSRNTGKIAIKIYSLRVNGVIPAGLAPKNLTLPTGFRGWVNASYSWAVGTTYKIELLTDRGSVMTTYATA